MLRIHRYIAPAILLAICFALAGCPPSVDEKIRERTRVPGLDEATQAIDMAIKSAVESNIHTDPVLDWYARQYTLTVEVSHAVVTVQMTVSTEKLHEQALKLARQEGRIKELIDNIKVDPDVERCPIEEDWVD